MARAYGVAGVNATGSATKTGVSLVGGATVRTRLYECTFSNYQTPASQAAQYAITRWTTSAGTAGSTPATIPVEPADVASITTAAVAHSAEPTYAANTDLYQLSLNQQASFRWLAVPGFELVNPATATTGLGVRLVQSTVALISNFSVFFFE